MVWQIHSHKLTSCLQDWDQLWIDDAYWHVLFSCILLVIMVLWRPTNNNQRYAFTPLLGNDLLFVAERLVTRFADASDDEDSEPLTGGIEAFGTSIEMHGTVS